LYAHYSVWQRSDNADGAEADAAAGVDDVTLSESDEPHSPLGLLSSSLPHSLRRRHRKRYATAARQSLPPSLPPPPPSALFADAGWQKLNSTHPVDVELRQPAAVPLWLRARVEGQLRCRLQQAH
jgi:hypothetical protein